MALKCDPSLWIDFDTYHLQGKSHDWWISWQNGRALNAPPVTFEKFSESIHRKIHVEKLENRKSYRI